MRKFRVNGEKKTWLFECDGCGASSEQLPLAWIVLNASVQANRTGTPATLDDNHLLDLIPPAELEVVLCTKCRKANRSIHEVIDRLILAQDVNSCPIIDREIVCVCEDEDRPLYHASDYLVERNKPASDPAPDTPLETASRKIMRSLMLVEGGGSVALRLMHKLVRKAYPFIIQSDFGVQSAREGKPSTRVKTSSANHGWAR